VYIVADVFGHLVSSLKNKDQVVLATIVSSSGSAPLPAGALMLVKEGGNVTFGTVGGGLLEARVIEEAGKYFDKPLPAAIRKIDLNDDVSNEGMICGGSVEVLLESIDSSDLVVFQKVQEIREAGEDCVLIRFVDAIQRSINRTVVESQSTTTPGFERFLETIGADNNALNEAVRHVFNQDIVRRVPGVRGEIIVQPVHGLQQLIVFGGGHISKHLSTIASVAGFSVSVIDDREEYADLSRFPEASRVLAVDYKKAFTTIAPTPATSIVIVTRGHQSDQEVLAQALQTQARYVGMIGSKRKVIACFKNLQAQGVATSALKRVHAPIGLDIGAITAEEIAVSIVAELIRVRRGVNTPSIPLAEQIKNLI
jgi:xanthine dehydrogenase accessory factor